MANGGRASLAEVSADGPVGSGVRPGPHRHEGRLRLAAVALVGVTLALRLLSLRHGAMSYDGLHSVTFAVQDSAIDVVRAVERFDPHPPLYYLQLHLWLDVFPTTTLWARLNAVVFSVLAVAALLAAAVPRFGWRVALIAGGLFALSPAAAFHAQDVRMYSLLMLVAVCSWWASARVIEGRRTWPDALLVAATSAAAVTIHAAGPLVVLAAVTYGLLWMAAEPGPRVRPWARLAAAQVVGASVVLPWALRRGSLSVDHTVAPTPADVARTAFELLLGAHFGSATWLVWAVAGLVVAVVVVAVSSGTEVRRPVVAFLVVPVAAAAVISHLIQPVWLPRTLAGCVPFLALAAAVVVDRGLRRWPAPTLAGAAVLAGAMLVAGTAHPGQGSVTFRDTAALVGRAAGPGDVVVLGGRRVFWGFGWHYLGPGAVDALAEPGPVQVPAGRPALFVDDARSPATDPTTSGDTWFVGGDRGASYRRYVERHDGAYDVEVRAAHRIGALDVMQVRFTPATG